MESEEAQGYDKRRDTYSEIIKFFVNNLSDDHYRANYVKELSEISKSPLEMAIKVGIAFGENCTKNQTAKAFKKNLLDSIEDKDAGKILRFCERHPRNFIETSGEYFILGKKLREACNVPDDYKTSDEIIKEAIERKAGAAKGEYVKNAEETKEEKTEKKPVKKSKIKEYFERTKGYMSKDIRNSLNASSRIVGHLESSIEKLIKPTKDFLNNPITLKNYHLVFILPVFLAGMYLFGNRETVIKPIMKFEERVIYGIDEMSVKTYYDIKNLGIKKSHNIDKTIKNAYNSSRKGIKNAWKYAVRTTTTTYGGLKDGIKNSDIALYFAKKGKDSVKNAAEEGKSLVKGYIDEKANEIVRKDERKK